MKKILFFFFAAGFLLNETGYSQIDDILRKIPGVGDVFEEAVTTSIKDAYPPAYWMKDFDKDLSLKGGVNFSTNLEPGYYRWRFNTFCLHAGTYAPTEGAGYLVAPLKGAKAKLINDIFLRYSEHPEIAQTDVQLLVWGIEAGQKFSSYPPDFQLRIQPLLKPEEIAKMEIDVNQIAMDLLPQEVQEVLNLYSDIRYKLSDATSTYEDIERIAVKTGIAPLGKGSKNFDVGTWTSIGDGVFMRCFPEGFPKSEVEIFIPEDVKIQKDNDGNITSFDNGSFKIDLNYEAGSDKFKTAVIKDISTSEETTIENTITDISTMKKDSEDFISLVKKSLGKKKSKRLTVGTQKILTQLKSLEYSISSVTEKGSLISDGNKLCVNAIGNIISEVEGGSKKGGGINHKTGLGNVSGLVFAPANTSMQRLGNGGPEGGGPSEGGPPNEGNPPKEKEKEKECKVHVSISQVNESELPKPDWVYTVTADITIEGNDEKCTAEEITFTLFDVSKERGRYMNDNEQVDDVDEDLQISDLNSDYTITKTTATKQLSGKSQTQQIAIVCRDYGAYGKLKASVKVKGTWYEADADGAPDKFVTIPLDLNDNKIADSWEKQKNVYGKPAEWDEDPTPTGQARNGDGMTNYEEYRGFFVSDGADGTEHTRMDPLQKEIFVIDMDKIFDVASWKSASGIKAYWLTTALVYGTKGGAELDQNYRWVNFCRGYAQGLKYAVLLKKINGIDDPYNLCGTGKEYNGCNSGSPVKNAKLTIILPDRTRKWLTETRDTMSAWLAKYPGAKYLYFGSTKLSTKWMKNFVDIMNNPAKFEEVMNFYNNQVAIHEVGHALGVPHHGGGDPKKTQTGEHNCPMRYLEYFDPVYINDAWLKKVLDLFDSEGNVIVTYTKWKFCKTKDNCWSKLNANDR